MSELEFFIPCNPPTATAQQQKTAVINGHVRKYDPKNVKAGKLELFAMLQPHRPSAPLEGPLNVSIAWIFPFPLGTPKKVLAKGTAPRRQRPDLDNLFKGMADVMTRLGYWRDDSQIAELALSKFQAAENCGIKIKIKTMG